MAHPLETIILPHLEQYPIKAALFHDVRNAAFLRQQLLDGNADFQYTFLDASAILCRDHLLAACFRAINDLAQKRLRTKNVHSEVVFSLSPNNNIAESFKRFGISPESENLIALKIATLDSPEDGAHLLQHVDGNPSRLTDSELIKLRDLRRLAKIYKFDLPSAASDTTATEQTRMLSVVTSAMALKGL